MPQPGRVLSRAAIEQYREIVKAAPDNVAALNNLAWLLYEQGEAQAAVAYARQPYDRAPDKMEVADTLG